MSTTWRRRIGLLHLWIGLIFCAPLTAMGLSGGVMAFQALLRVPGIVASAPAGDRKPIAAVLDAARRAAPLGFVATAYLAPRGAGDPASVRLTVPGRGDGRRQTMTLRLDPVTLQIRTPGFGERLHDTFLKFHSTLFAGDLGRQIVGWSGMAMLALGASGLVNWWPRSGRWRRAFTIDTSARGPAFQRELHKTLGIWSLAIYLTVALSGLTLAFPQTLRAGLAVLLPSQTLVPPSVVPVEGATPMSIDAAIDLATAALPGTATSAIFLPMKPTQPLRFVMAGLDPSRSTAPGIVVFIDPWTHRILDVQDPGDLRRATSWLAWLRAIHTGQGLGPVWSALQGVMGLLPLAFATTGIRLFLLKRRARRSRRQPFLSRSIET